MGLESHLMTTTTKISEAFRNHIVYVLFFTSKFVFDNRNCTTFQVTMVLVIKRQSEVINSSVALPVLNIG